MFPNKVHFIGIGGIGISALARYFLALGWKVSGSDVSASEITAALEKEGALISIGHDETNIPRRTELIIYSAAVKKDNPERKIAKELKIKTLSYAQALGRLTKNYFTIAVSGAHGKSTTTALISLILMRAGLDPTVIIGTKLRELSGLNFRSGRSRYLVLEADEWNRSFHNYFPKIAILTNIDKEHLDTYKNFQGVVAGFKRYLKNLRKDGILIANWGDKALRRLAESVAKRGIKVIFFNHGRFKKHLLGIPGVHNQLNAEAAWIAAKHLAVKRPLVEQVFKNYTGAWRRLEKLNSPFSMSRVTFYTDYAHHPTEIKATIQALREKYPSRELICVFQPHHEGRLEKLFKDFIPAFDGADVVVLTPVYRVSGREYKSGLGSFELAQKIKEKKERTFYAENLTSVMKIVSRYLDYGPVVVFMSAGDLDSQVRRFLL